MSDYLRGLFGLNGRVALVTGGSSGIGRGMAAALAGAGARVVVLARGEADLKETVATLTADGAEAGWVSADRADRGAVAAGADSVGGGVGGGAGLAGHCRRHQPPPADDRADRGAVGPDHGREPDRAVPARPAV